MYPPLRCGGPGYRTRRKRNWALPLRCAGFSRGHDQSPHSLTVPRRQARVRWTFSNRTSLDGPDPFTDRDIRTLLPWADRAFPDLEDYEAIVVLRRSWLVPGVRNTNLDEFPNAAVRTGGKMGACLVFQPGVAEYDQRNLGSTLDFTESPERLLSDQSLSGWFSERQAKKQE